MDSSEASSTSSLLAQWDALCDGYTHVFYQNERKINFFLGLLAEFRTAGIEAIPLKGMDFLLRAYPFSGLRPMADIDLLIQGEAVSHVRQTLESKGLKRVPDEGLTYVSSDGVITLDIIWDIWYLKDTAPLWERLVSHHVHGVEVHFLHPEDTLTYFIDFVVTHRGILSPLFAKDLEYFLEREGFRINWTNWIARVKELHFDPAFYYGLSYAKQKDMHGIPVEVTDAFRPVGIWKRGLRFFYRVRATGRGMFPISYLRTWLSYPGLKGKVRLLRQSFFPRKCEVEIRYGKKNWAEYFLWILLHPFSIFVRGIVFFARDAYLFLRRSCFHL